MTLLQIRDTCLERVEPAFQLLPLCVVLAIYELYLGIEPAFHLLPLCVVLAIYESNRSSIVGVAVPVVRRSGYL